MRALQRCSRGHCLMGHTMSEVTEIYAHLAASDADINQLNAQRLDPRDGGTVGVKG